MDIMRLKDPQFRWVRQLFSRIVLFRFGNNHIATHISQKVVKIDVVPESLPLAEELSTKLDTRTRGGSTLPWCCQTEGAAHGGVQMDDGTWRRRMYPELHQLLEEPHILHTAKIW